MGRFIYREIVLLWVTFFIIQKVATASEYHITHFTNDNGLPQSSVKLLEMDKYGFIWMITESGLIRFDGQHFRIIDRKAYPVLGSHYIATLRTTPDRQIILEDEQSSLYFFNKHNQLVKGGHMMGDELFIAIDRYKYYSAAEKREVNKKGIWLCEYSCDENNLLSCKIKGSNEGFACIHFRMLYYISGKHVTWRIPLPDASNSVTRYAGHLGGKYYYIDTTFNIKQVDRNGRVNKVMLKGIDPALKVQGYNTYKHGLFQQGAQLYLLEGKGIYQLKESGEHELTATLMLETDIQGIIIYRNYPERNLQIVGSITQGLYLFRKKQFKALTFKNGAGIFYPQAPYKDSGVLTTLGIIFPGSSRQDHPFKMEDNRSILLDRRGHYWVNKNNRNAKIGSDGITELDENLNPVRTLHNLYGVDCYRQTPDGNIWMSTFQGRLLGKLSGDSIAWLKTVWPPGTFVTFLPENNEEFWVGGHRTFMKLNVRTGKEKHYKELERTIVRAFYVDKNKVLWIGTMGSGFFALKNDKLYKLPLHKKGNLHTVHTFLEDKSGFMWMTTNNGLFRCKKEDIDNFIAGKIANVYYQCFKKESGFNTNEFNGGCTPSGIILKNGKFSLPSLDGLVQFYPDSIREELPGKRIFIDRVLADGKEQDLSRVITLSPSFKRFQVEVSAPFLGNSDNQQIEYNVKGLDPDWYPVNNDNQVILNGMPYGKYSLQFRMCGGFGSNNIVSVTIPFKVLPWFYQTWTFRIMIIAAIALLIFLFVKLRYQYLMKRNRELEQVIAQRTAHLDNANQLKEKMLMMVGHDLQSPLHFLGYLSDSNYEAVTSNQNKKASLISREIKTTSSKIYAFVGEFTLWSRVQDERFNLKKTVFPFRPLVEEIALFFKEILLQHQNKFEFKVDEEFELYANKELLKAILRNLVDNAQKHTRNGTISIQCDKGPGNTCMIRVSDTGNGMSPETLKKIRSIIKRKETIVDMESGNGLGYQFINDFASQLDVQLSIESEEHKGTTVTIHGITLKQATYSNKEIT